MKALLSAAVALALSVSAVAQAGSLVDVSVIDRDTGSVLATHRHDGKFYIAGVPGHRYAVRLCNRSGARVLTVLSVDGVNAITGQTASPGQSGYVLDAWEEAPFYSDRERAALALTEAVTRITEDHVPDAVFERARAHFNEQELIALVFTLTTINAWNRLAITMRTEVGNYQPKARPVSQTA